MEHETESAGLSSKKQKKNKNKKKPTGWFCFSSITYKHETLLISKSATDTNPKSLSLENIYQQAYLSVEGKRKDELEGANANI